MADNPNDPMSFLKNLWGSNGFALPGMVAPTLDTDELEKQIRDLKTVEGWLRTNLSMLSMTIQNLEMQRTTLSAVRTMSQMYADQSAAAAPGPADAGDASNNFAQAAMWPWNMMQQMQESMAQASAEAQQQTPATGAATAHASHSSHSAAPSGTPAGSSRPAAGAASEHTPQNGARRKKTS